MPDINLSGELSERAERLGVPGVAVGVHADGEEYYAFHGVTSVENPLPVDETTVFQFASIGKTYTATAMVCLVEQGRVDLDAPVRTYVPELRLRDPEVLEKVTVLQLLNHTAGWEGDYSKDTGHGDDALAQHVAGLAELDQVSPLGAVVTYNNAAFALAGRVIEKVTGTTYEQAIQDLLLKPIGLELSFFFADDVMTRRFAVGHLQHQDGTTTVARPWGSSRGGNPSGGLSSPVGDLMAWARFHLTNGLTADGSRVLPEDRVRAMRVPTAECPGSALGDAVGISWLLRDLGDVRVAQHGGSGIGQQSELVLVPERNFAIAVLSNSEPGGRDLNSEMVKWALEAYLGVVEPEPEVIEADAGRLGQYVGSYETIAMLMEVTAGQGRLLATPTVRPEVLEEAGEEAPPEMTAELALLPGDGDRYVVTGDAWNGMRGYFTRGSDGNVNGAHLGGRYFEKLPAPK